MLPRWSTIPLAGVLFTLSGALGLGYQLVWIRKATLIVGASQIALSTVLTSFFIGLALGSLWFGGHLRSRRFSPLFVYGLFEAAIGIYAFCFPSLFEWVEGSYAYLYPYAAGSEQMLFLLRFFLLFLLFLVPTFFMGGTLPLLLDGIVERDATIGSLTSLFYGLNIVGAVIGVLVSGYITIPTLGMNGTSLAAGIGNLTIAVLALVLFRGAAPIHPPSKETHQPGPSFFFCALALVSGLATIGYQVSWVRYFSLFNDSTVYLTAVLLAVFLTALATGSIVMSRILARGFRPLRVVALLQPLAALLVLYGLEWWTIAEYQLPRSNPRMEPSWYFFSPAADATFFAPLLQIGLVVFLPVALLGTALPGIIVEATRHSTELRNVSGRLVFWNTLGASAGGFGAGYILLPNIGLTGTLFAFAFLTIALGLAAESWLVKKGGTSLSVGPGHLMGIAALLGTLWFLRGDVTLETVQKHGVGKRFRSMEVLDLIEGPITTATVFADATQRVIASGNQVLAVVADSLLSVQAVEGHLPALFYPRAGAPERVLGIAVGSGQSFGAMLMYPIKQMDVVDISAAMIGLSLTRFKEFNHNLGADPRVTIHLDDGRHFVERAPPEQYDAVSMEPPPPTAEGVHALYSLQFYQSIKRVLREDGVLMQWVPLYWLTPNEARSLIKTQAEVFPYTFIVRTGPVDFMTLSFKRDRPPRFSTAWLEERGRTFAQERMVSERRWRMECQYDTASLEGILALIIAGPEDVARLEAPYIYEDDDQRLSYSSGDRELLRHYPWDRLVQFSFAALPLTPFSELQHYFVEPIPVRELDAERARALLRYDLPDPAEVEDTENHYEIANSPRDRLNLALTLARLQRGNLATALTWLRRAIDAQSEVNVARPDLGPALEIARAHVDLHATKLQTWIDDLPKASRTTPLARAVEKVLQQHLEREQERRSAYLW